MEDSGNPMYGFKWWNFAYPTLVTSGANAIHGVPQAVGTVKSYVPTYAGQAPAQ
jgi:hypothetical protein